MKKLANNLLYMDTHDSLVQVFRAWRLWFVGAMLGALIAAGVYWVFPPEWRARAVVVVDFNIEEYYPVPPGKQFYFLGREARKLQELAFSDETLQLVADQLNGVTVQDLREDILSLSQPEDGAWHFFADSRDAAQAEKIAGIWAETFYQQVLDGIEISAVLEEYRAEIVRLMEENPDMSSGEINYLATQLVPEINKSMSITPYLELTLSQVNNLKIERNVPLSVYVLSGSVIGACGLAIATLMFLRKEELDAFLVE
jgi:hypothetical protein